MCNRDLICVSLLWKPGCPSDITAMKQRFGQTDSKWPFRKISKSVLPYAKLSWSHTCFESLPGEMKWLNSELIELILISSPIILSEVPDSHEYDESEKNSVTENAQVNSWMQSTQTICFQNSKPIIFLSEQKPSSVSESTKIIY